MNRNKISSWYALAFILVPTIKQDSYAPPSFPSQIDRKNTYRQIGNLVFPHWNPQAGPGALCNSTIIDGELVCDIDRKTGEVSVFRLKLRNPTDCVLVS